METEKLLQSPWHEIRLFAVFQMVDLFKKKKPDQKKDVFHAYVRNLDRINNWDLVDSSAPYLTGPWFWNRDRSLLYDWIKNDSLWIRRIGVMSTFFFIKQGDYADALVFCEELLSDREDLIHKATGWMLREIGNRDGAAERAFLEKHVSRMPRTMLRYAIEKFPPEERKDWLAGGPGSLPVE
ncbi:MAG: DNA alkylation repair protein [Spirochaetales bacterium]|nr:DNA alkylation repair protein [Spirochaetales bacterium]